MSPQCQHRLGLGSLLPQGPIPARHPYCRWHASLPFEPDRRLRNGTGTPLHLAAQTPIKWKQAQTFPATEIEGSNGYNPPTRICNTSWETVVRILPQGSERSDHE